jgi:hypothetical protein
VSEDSLFKVYLLLFVYKKVSATNCLSLFFENNASTILQPPSSVNEVSLRLRDVNELFFFKHSAISNAFIFSLTDYIQV